MPDIFKVGLAKIINTALSPLVFDLTLIKVEPGTPSADLTDGTQPTETNVSGKGFVDTYQTNEIDGTIVQKGDRKVAILGESLGGVIPEPSDKITIESETKVIVDVKRDPAGALYECQVR